MKSLVGGGLAALIAILVVTGCGGSGDATAEVLTKTQFIKQGDAICRRAQGKKEKAIRIFAEEKAKEGKELGTLTPKEYRHVFATVALPPVKQASTELGDLEPPAGDIKAQKLVQSLASAVEALENDPSLISEEVPYYRWDKRAYAYGFRVCSKF